MNGPVRFKALFDVRKQGNELGHPEWKNSRLSLAKGIEIHPVFSVGTQAPILFTTKPKLLIKDIILVEWFPEIYCWEDDPYRWWYCEFKKHIYGYSGMIVESTHFVKK